MKTDLRLTDTNAASDSKGRTWGLEGGLFWWLVGGIGAAITLFFVLLVMVKSVKVSPLVRCKVSVVPILASGGMIIVRNSNQPIGRP